MEKFALSLNEGKTRLIEFGRYANERRKKRNEGKALTFDFLGFTHICSKASTGKLQILRRDLGRVTEITSFSQFKSSSFSARTSPTRNPYTANSMMMARSRMFFGWSPSVLLSRRWTFSHDGPFGRP
jgi:hypothetical protein